MSNKSEVDPMTLAVLRNALYAINHEMGVIVLRSARSPLINQIHDFSMAIFNEEGRMMVQVESLPIHVAGSHLQMLAVRETYGDDIYEGDVITFNDMYYKGLGAGSHVGDWAFMRPVFYKGKLAMWAYCRAHQMDPGGAIPVGFDPRAYDIHAEGILIPPLKLYEKGKPKDDIFRFIASNVRRPDWQRQDVNAIIGALKVCERRIVELFDKYGEEKVRDCFEVMIEGSEKAMRDEIEKIPDGLYTGTNTVDNDGNTPEPVRANVTIKVQGRDLIADFTGSDKQRKYINSPLMNTLATVYYSVFVTIAPHLMHNEGCYRPIQVIAPKGTWVNPTYPATVNGCTNVSSSSIANAIFMALAKAVPEKTCAMWAAESSGIISGYDPRIGNDLYLCIDFGYNGGEGAKVGYDGFHHLSPLECGGVILKETVEMKEINYPWLHSRYELWTDSAGAGKWRGGLGVIEARMNLGSDPTYESNVGSNAKPTSQPLGHSGGRPAALTEYYVVRKESGERVSLDSNFGIQVSQGDIIEVRSSGGGGVGNPRERDIEKVKYDVENGYVSIKSAREDYGVVIDSKTFEIDHEATGKLRKTENA